MSRRTLIALAALLAGTACAGDAEPGAETAADTSVGTPAATGTVAEPAGGEFLDPDAATREQLMAVAPLDSALADALIAGRPYASMTAVDEVLAARLDEAGRDSVYTRLWKPIDLNSASEQEILLIPGVGPRMQHEFEEYRPYTSMEQFRREIGKYVDDAEVARLERYVTIR